MKSDNACDDVDNRKLGGVPESRRQEMSTGRRNVSNRKIANYCWSHQIYVDEVDMTYSECVWGNQKLVQSLKGRLK